MVTASDERFPEVKTLAPGHKLVSSIPPLAWLSLSRRECIVAVLIHPRLLRYPWRGSTTTY